MAPPKRKTGGRTTAPGTQPGVAPARRATPSTDEPAEREFSSGRYTAPTMQSIEQSPQWVPMLMIGLFVLGGLAIITRYLWWDSNVPMLIGIAAILGGLGTATQWK